MTGTVLQASHSARVYIEQSFLHDKRKISQFPWKALFQIPVSRYNSPAKERIKRTVCVENFVRKLLQVIYNLARKLPPIPWDLKLFQVKRLQKYCVAKRSTRWIETVPATEGHFEKNLLCKGIREMHLKPLNYFSPYISSHCFITSSWCIFHDRLSLRSLALLMQDWMITPKPVSCPKRSQKHHHSLFKNRDKYYLGWNMVIVVHSPCRSLLQHNHQGKGVTRHILPCLFPFMSNSSGDWQGKLSLNILFFQ